MSNILEIELKFDRTIELLEFTVLNQAEEIRSGCNGNGYIKFIVPRNAIRILSSDCVQIYNDDKVYIGGCELRERANRDSYYIDKKEYFIFIYKLLKSLHFMCENKFAFYNDDMKCLVKPNLDKYYE